MNQIEEAIHPQIQSILDDSRLNAFVRHDAMSRIHQTLLKQGKDTGITNTRPLKGSSRAVYFPSDPDTITLDGKETHVPTALKMAIQTPLDQYTGENQMLGQLQTKLEGSSRFDPWRIITKDDQGTYKTNHAGVLAPLFHVHPNGDYSVMAKVRPLKDNDFKRLTATEANPAGFSMGDLREYVLEHSAAMVGRHYPREIAPDVAPHVESHPFTKSMIELTTEAHLAPGDVNDSNIGIWEHPHTGKEHLVMMDYGLDKHIGAKYSYAQKKMFEANKSGNSSAFFTKQK